MKYNKLIGIIITVLLCASMVMAGPFRVDENLEMGTNDIYNATNINATYFYGTLIGSWTPAGDVDMMGYSAYNLADLNATAIYQGGNIVLDSSDEANLNVNHSDTSTLAATATTWDGETSQANLNVNSSNYWDSLDTPLDITALGTIGSATSITSTAFVGPLTGNADSATTWDGETSQANLNVNSSNYWDGIDTPGDFAAITASGLITANEFTGAQNWTDNQNYPTACPADTFATQIGDTITCTAISDVYLLNSGDTGAGPYNFTGNVEIGTADGSAAELHVSNADSGVDCIASTRGCFENSGTTYLGILGGTGNTVGINVGDPDDADIGGINYANSLDKWTIRAGTTNVVDIDSVSVDVLGSAYLDVAGAGTTINGLVIDGSGIDIKRSGGSGNIRFFNDTAGSVGWVMYMSDPTNWDLRTHASNRDGADYIISKNYNTAALFNVDIDTGDTSIAGTLDVVQTGVTGNTGYFYRNLASASTDDVVFEVIQDNAGDNQGAMVVQQDGAGNAISVSNYGSGVGIYLKQNTLSVNEAMWAYSNVDGTSNKPLVFVEVDNVAFDQEALYIQNDGIAEAIFVQNNGAAEGLQIDQNGNGRGIYVDNAGTGEGIRVYQSNDASGAAYYYRDLSSLSTTGIGQNKATATGTNYFFRNLDAADTAGAVMFIEQDHITDDQPALKVQQDGTGNAVQLTTNLNGISVINAGDAGYGLFVQSVGDSRALNILKGVGVRDAILLENDGTGSAISINQDGDTGTAGAVNIENTANNGIGLNVYSNEDAAATNPLVYIEADNPLFDQAALKIQQDGTAEGIYIDQTGTGLGLRVANSGPGAGVFIDQNGDAIALNIDSEATSTGSLGVKVDMGGAGGRVFDFAASSDQAFRQQLTSDNPTWYMQRNADSGTTGGEMFRIVQDNAADDQEALVVIQDGTSNWAQKITTAGFGLTVENSGVGDGVLVDQDGNGIGLNIDSEASTATQYGLNVVTTGTGATAGYFGSGSTHYTLLGQRYGTPNGGNVFYRDYASAVTASPLVIITQDNAGDDQQALLVQQDGTGKAIDTPTGVSTLNSYYGEMYTYDSTTATTFAASDVYYNITVDMAVGELNGFTYSSGVLTVPETGVYRCGFSDSFSGGNNIEFHAAIGINGVRSQMCHIQRKLGAGGDVGVAAGSCVLSLTAGDDLTLMMENVDDTTNPTVHDANVNCVWVGY